MYLRKISCGNLSSLFSFIFSAPQFESYRLFILTAKTPYKLFLYIQEKRKLVSFLRHAA
jgi:hypothetical protein